MNDVRSAVVFSLNLKHCSVILAITKMHFSKNCLNGKLNVPLWYHSVPREINERNNIKSSSAVV